MIPEKDCSITINLLPLVHDKEVCHYTDTDNEIQFFIFFFLLQDLLSFLESSIHGFLDSLPVVIPC